MKVGDYVQITRLSAGEFGEYGQITRLRVAGEWYVRHESGRVLSWQESSLIVVSSESDYTVACQVLGEDYFA